MVYGVSYTSCRMCKLCVSHGVPHLPLSPHLAPQVEHSFSVYAHLVELAVEVAWEYRSCVACVVCKYVQFGRFGACFSLK